MKYKPAKGIKGFILRTAAGPVFRVYNKDKSFTDYDLVHFDLEVEILDDDAFFYEYDIGATLDHSPSSLGIENEDSIRL